jgi:MFS family permease
MILEQFKAEESLILSIGLGSLILPFVIFAPWSSWLGDRFSKRTTTIWLKAAEVVLVALGIWSIQTGHLGTMFAVLFLLGTQSALLSTAKYGIISELVPRSSLSAANGLVALVTLVAAIVGAGAGMQLGEHAIASKSLFRAGLVEISLPRPRKPTGSGLRTATSCFIAVVWMQSIMNCRGEAICLCFQSQ